MSDQAPRRICFVTATRADYGHLYWVMKAVQADAALQLQVIVSGAHLCEQWGRTEQVVVRDGFPVDARIEMQMAGDSGVGVSKSTALATMGFAEAYERLSPDLVVLLGDRYEELAAAQAALFMRVPVAHIHGGETSEGAMDESIRHAVTKMSHVHFAAAESYRQRILQMGENPAMVFNFGAPGLDHLQQTPMMSLPELEQDLGVALAGKPVFLVTYHPATLGDIEPGAAADELMSALEAYPDAAVIFTGVNADAGNAAISSRIQAYAARYPERVRIFNSLGQRRYLSLMQCADVVIGNSSSGLIEAPAVRVPTVNIGDRQRGRLKALSVIDCLENAGDIRRAIDLALSESFMAGLPQDVSLYGKGDAAVRIAQKLKTVGLDGILAKKFYDYMPSGN